MIDDLNGRRIYARRGPTTGFQDADADAQNLADTVAAAAEGKLLLKDGRLLWLKDGRLVEVSLDVLDEFVRTHVVSQKLVDRGGDAGWALEFAPLQLSRNALRTLLSPGTVKGGSLIPRIGMA